jgi:hypothetical protein
MAILERIWVVHTTSTADDAETDSGITLEIQSGAQRMSKVLPDLPHDERERGRTDEYELDLRDFQFDTDVLQPGDFRFTIRGDDAWLPESIWVIGRTVNGDFELLIARPYWPGTAWFSSDSHEGQVTIPLNQA